MVLTSVQKVKASMRTESEGFRDGTRVVIGSAGRSSRADIYTPPTGGAGAMAKAVTWQVTRTGVAAVYFWIGGQYLFGHANPDPSLHLLTHLLPGGGRTHGLILCLLAFFVASRPTFKNQMPVALLATLFYSLVTTSLITGAWIVQGSWVSTLGWYPLVAALTFVLVFTRPGTNMRVIMRRGG